MKENTMNLSQQSRDKELLEMNYPYHIQKKLDDGNYQE
jgi:hypothetical protein